MSVPAHAIGMDARALNARRTAALIEANRRLTEARAWYGAIVDAFRTTGEF